MVKRLLVLVLFITSCVSSSVSVANAAGGVAPDSLSAAVLAMSALPTSATSTTVPAKKVKAVKPVKTTVPVKPKNKNGASAVGTTVPVIANVSNISTGAAGSSGAVVLPVEVPGLISVCVNKSTSVLRDTADNSCSSGSEVKVEWLDTGMSPKICVNNNNREMTLAQDGKCSTKNSAVADVTANKQILACADDKTGVLRYRASGVCGVKTDPVVWVLKDQGVARNVDSGVKQGVVEIISLIPTAVAGAGSTKTVTTSPATTTTIAIATTVSTATTSTTTSTTTTVARAVGSFAGYLGGTCPDGSGVPWYWGSGGTARAGGCSAAASIAPISTGSSGSSGSAATTTTTTAAPVIPGTPATPTGVAGNTQVTVSVTAGTGGTPASYTITQSTTSGGTYSTGCTVTGASGSCVVTGLTNGTTYFFKTTATNTAGTSGLSTASSSVTPATVPGAPTIGTATVASATSVTVACTAPGSNGGATITTYTATAVGTAITGTLTSATCSSEITVSGLTTGTAYTFTVTATNTAGTSVASGASNSVTPAITCAAGGTCILGNTGPGGGRVFYVSATNFTSTGSACGTACKYLEYAPTGWIVATTPAGQTNCAASAGTSSNDPKCQYVPTGALTSTLLWPTTCPPPSCTAMNIGSGHSNTTTWLGQSASAGYAPTVARAYQGGGLTDWHLPSKHELNQMCRDVWGLLLDNTAITCSGMTGTIRVGFLNDGSFYGSSTEYQANGNHALRFSDGTWANNAKSNAGPVVVRPVRAFGPTP